jgi:hypothetical protein
LEAQLVLEEYFVSLVRVRSSIAAEYTPATRPDGLRRSPLNGHTLLASLRALNICRLADELACYILYH